MFEVTPVFCDWLTVLAATSSIDGYLTKMLRNQDTKQAQKAYHRSHAVEYYPSGIRHFFTPHQTELPSILVFDGEAMNTQRNLWGNEGSLKVCSILSRRCEHITRIDLAIDYMDNGLLAQRVAAEGGDGNIKTGRRSLTVVRQHGGAGGCTTYIGARTSPVMLRIYDKSAESKGKQPASRIELEIKHEAAHEVTSILAGFGGHLKASSLFVGFLQQMADWSGFPEIEALRYGEVTTVDLHRQERLKDKKEWLRRQVLPTFAKDPDMNGGELWLWFSALVEYARTGA